MWKKSPSPSLLSLLILTTIIWTASADCPLSRYPRQTTVGYIRADFDATQNQNTAQVYEYPLVQQLRSSTLSRTAVGVSGFSVEKRSQQFGYKVQPSLPRSPASTVIFTISVFGAGNNDRWRYIMLNFIVSDIPELILGTKNALELTPTSNSNVLRVNEMVPLPSSDFRYKATSKIFLSGLQVKQKNSMSKQSISKIDDTINKVKQLQQYSWSSALIKKFVSTLSTNKMPSLTLSEPQLNQNGLLAFEITLSQLELKAFSYSFLIYLQKTSGDMNYQTISGSFSFVDQDTYFYNQLAYDGMKILGLSGFKYSNQGPGVISLDVQNEASEGRTFFVGKIQNALNQFNIQFFGIATLPGSVCRTCPGSPLIYEEFCVSECPTGFISSINSDGSFYCHSCPIENFLIAHEDKRSCVCASGHYLISPTQSCDICPYDCLTCNGNTCLTCDTPIPSTFRTLNPRTGRCECTGLGIVDDFSGQNRRCLQCNPRCKTCKGPQIYDCLTCLPGRTLVNGICRCEENLTQNESNQCLCLPPYAQSANGKCTLSQNKCKQNENLVVLPSGQKFCNCKPGFTRSIVSNLCLKECQSTEQLDYETSQCKCRSGSLRDPLTKLCTPCTSKLNQLYNESTNSCECMPGFEMNAKGNCISCPAKTYFNAKSDSCQCVFNYFKKRNECVKCQTQWDGDGCRKLSNAGGLEL